jgi:hypothetical protein
MPIKSIQTALGWYKKKEKERGRMKERKKPCNSQPKNDTLI